MDPIASLIPLALYFLPTIIAMSRKHRQKFPIMIVNIFTGWTLIGWVVALAWCVSPNVETEEFK